MGEKEVGEEEERVEEGVEVGASEETTDNVVIGPAILLMVTVCH